MKIVRRKIKLDIGCCGDCPYYNWKKHKCSEGASLELDARKPFYDDCPLDFEDYEVQKNEQ